MNVLVLKGGDSTEREVSLRSADAVVRGLKANGYKVTEYDTINGVEKLRNMTEGVDLVLPILHGKNGEDGAIQEILEDIGISFLGAGSKSSEITFDKVMTHECLENYCLKMPQYEVVNINTFSGSEIVKHPFVLKPISGGSSIDTVIVRESTNDKIMKSRKLFKKYKSMLIEELIEGDEITVSILGEDVLPIILIKPPNNQEFDYKNKYNGSTKEICPVPDSMISDVLQKQAQGVAKKVHNVLGIRHISRTDIMIDKNKEMYVLETNTMPGLTAQSLLPASAKVRGLDMVQLSDRLVKIVLGEI